MCEAQKLFGEATFPRFCRAKGVLISKMFSLNVNHICEKLPLNKILPAEYVMVLNKNPVINTNTIWSHLIHRFCSTDAEEVVFNKSMPSTEDLYRRVRSGSLHTVIWAVVSWLVRQAKYVFLSPGVYLESVCLCLFWQLNQLYSIRGWGEDTSTLRIMERMWMLRNLVGTKNKIFSTYKI